MAAEKLALKAEALQMVAEKLACQGNSTIVRNLYCEFL